MTTVSSPNADIAQQARTAASRASSSSSTTKNGEQPADPFAALFDAAMLLQTDPGLATVVPPTVGKDLKDETVLADDNALIGDEPVDPASLPWTLPVNPVTTPAQAAALPVDVKTGEETTDLAAAPAELPTTSTAPPDPVAVAVPTPESTSLANLLAPGNQAASGVRRAGQTLSAPQLGVQARGDSASDADTDGKTGKIAPDDGIDVTPQASAAALELAAVNNAAAVGARNAMAGNTAADAGVAAPNLVATDTSTASASAATTGTTAAPRHELPTVPGAPVPLHAQQLQARVDDAVRWMSTQSIQTAQIRVTPDNMGPITVHVSMDGDIANITFSSEHAQTRQVLETSMGGLRTALGENGLQLGQAQVGSEQQNQQAFASFANSGNGDERRARQSAAERMQATVSALGGRSQPIAQSGNGLVDLYA